jgi:8-amino-7-oxononanoate synthase
VLDLTSALYLGMRHPSAALRPWDALTLGKPAALGAPSESESLARALAELQGSEHAVLAPSTLHLFWDLFTMLAERGMSIHLDAGAYAVARWGAERAGARGAVVRRFAHHDVAALREQIARDRAPGTAPVIVTDGFCPVCGRAAPLGEYLGIVEREGGYLVVDDTQSIGLLGHGASAERPYGRGGGGSLAYHGLASRRAIVGSSLAKGFGVPVAVLAAGHALVRQFVQHSETAVHSSPPSLATLRAAEHALAVNRACGDALRARLAQHVRRFRDGLRRLGIPVSGGLFPVQTIRPARAVEAVHRELLELGLRTVPIRDCRGGRGRIAAIVTAIQRPSDIDRAVDIIARALTTPAFASHSGAPP